MWNLEELCRIGDREGAVLAVDPEAIGLPAYVQREFYDYVRCGILAGCDRSTPNKLRRLLPTSSAFRLVHLDYGHRFRSQVALMDVLPDTT